MLLVFLLATLGMVSTATEPPPRADRTPLDWQQEVRRRGIDAAVAPAAALATDPVTGLPRSHRALRVLGNDGRPVVGIGVRFKRIGKSEETKTITDALGIASYDPEGEGVEAVVAGAKTVWLEKPLTVVQMDGLLPVTAVYMDTQTGEEIKRGRTVPSHVFAQAQTEVGAVDAPEGYVLLKGTMRVGTTFRTKRAVLRVPTRPHARIVIRVREPDGSAAAGAVLANATMGAAPPVFEDGPEPDELEEPDKPDFVVDLNGTWFKTGSTAAADAAGRILVRGVPFLQGERIGLTVEKAGRHAYVEAVLGADNNGCEVEVVLPRAVNHEACNEIWGIGGGSSGWRSGRSVVSGSAEVHVFCRDGTPARRVRVAIKSGLHTWEADTDGEGIARFDRLWSGPLTAEVREHGFVRAYTEFEARGHVRVELHEPAGWTARILVLDELGRPVPFAAMRVTGHGMLHRAVASDGTQELVLYTDHRGELELTHVSDGPVEVNASFGTRSGTRKVKPGDGIGIVRLSD